jgi:hypothetical protein
MAVGSSPEGIAITPNGEAGYVTGGIPTVTQLELATDTAGTPIPLALGSSP